ncbi:MAG TPA: MotA/TolQ/ExbB proton channel family protein [Beijerinckiaceae bacterium]|jgi:ABC-type multidrug transport system fused ATPase/permease subunit|nr:MotA/TolQ/ExbB proton channel family protein [Beijerinckiaceae bacterium]
MNALEHSLFEVSKLFLMPVLVLIALSLVYALTMLGAFLAESLLRMRGSYRSRLLHHAEASGAASADLELWIMKQLEWLRIVARCAPMLGLVATMIPMGPALLALTTNDSRSISENLVVAFSAVILALVSAAIAFFVLSIKRRWFLQELRAIERQRGA